MAIREVVTRPAANSGIVINGQHIAFTRADPFNAPRASAFLGPLPDESLHGAVEELFEAGAAALKLAQNSASTVILETKMAELVATLDKEMSENLGKRLETDREQAKETLLRLLQEQSSRINQLLTRYVDPNSKESLPSRVTDMFDNVARSAVRQIDALLQDGEEGALGKLGKKISEEIKQVEVNITKELAVRQALLTKSTLRGGQFEDVLAVRLPILVGAAGCHVDHCARTPGQKDREAGDYLITANTSESGSETVGIVVEAKSWKTRLSAEKIRQTMKLARANRGAAAGIFVAESTDILPDRLGFGQVSPCDYFVAFSPEAGDEVPLMCALYLARVAALATVKSEGNGSVDIAAAEREVNTIRVALEQFAKLETCHSKIDKEVMSGRGIAADISASILAALRRLDAILEV